MTHLEVAALCGMSSELLRAQVGRGEFPEPFWTPPGRSRLWYYRVEWIDYFLNPDNGGAWPDGVTFRSTSGSLDQSETLQ